MSFAQHFVFCSSSWLGIVRIMVRIRSEFLFFLMITTIVIFPAAVYGKRKAGTVSPKQDNSQGSGSEPVAQPDENFFNGDNFFKDFTSATPLPKTVQNLTDGFSRIGEIEDPSSKDPKSSLPGSASGIPDSLSALQTSTGGILDQITGLVGWSSMQTAVYPVIMILLCGFTGIFWAWVFIYLYTGFFTGKGYFGGKNRSNPGGFDSEWIWNTLPPYIASAVETWERVQNAIN